MDGRAHNDSKYSASMVSRGKNKPDPWRIETTESIINKAVVDVRLSPRTGADPW